MISFERNFANGDIYTIDNRVLSYVSICKIVYDKIIINIYSLMSFAIGVTAGLMLTTFMFLRS